MVEPCRWRMIDGWMYTLCWLIVAGRCIGVEGRRLYGLYMVLVLALLCGGVWFAIGVLVFWPDSGAAAGFWCRFL